MFKQYIQRKWTSKKGGLDPTRDKNTRALTGLGGEGVEPNL